MRNRGDIIAAPGTDPAVGALALLRDRILMNLWGVPWRYRWEVVTGGEFEEPECLDGFLAGAVNAVRPR